MLTFRLSRFAVVALTAVAACDSDAIPIDEFPARYQQRLCELNTTCAISPDQATCDAAYDVALFKLGTIVAAVKRGTIKYDGALAQECLDQLGAGCVAHVETPAACYGTFQGTISMGGACVTRDECANRARCDKPSGCTDACCAGTCGPAQAAIGGSCGGTLVSCPENAYCSDANICVAKLALGAPCTDSFYCADPGTCSSNDGTTPGTCVARAASGAACDVTVTDVCLRIDEFCDPATAKCLKRKKPGSVCAGNGECVGYASCASGTCVSIATLGEACDFAAQQYCQGFLTCEAGVCATPDPAPTCTP